MHVLNDAFVSVNGTDISATVKSVSVPREVAQLNATRMGHGTEVFEPGLRSWTMELTILNNFASAQVDATLSALFDARTKFTVIVRPSNTAIGVNNPQWSGSGFISSYNPVNGSVGELAESTVTITAAGALTRATA